MYSILQKSITKYCQYCTFKIFHFLRIVKRIALTNFVAFFCENEVGDYEFNDCIIYNISIDPYDHITSQIDSQDIISEVTDIEFRKESIEEYIQMKLRNEKVRRNIENLERPLELTIVIYNLKIEP